MAARFLKRRETTPSQSGRHNRTSVPCCGHVRLTRQKQGVTRLGDACPTLALPAQARALSRRSKRGSSLLASLLAAWAGACSGSPGSGGTLATLSARIEADQQGTVFELSSKLWAQRSSVARYRELADRATGALLTPFVTESGAPLLTETAARARGTCGVTFVSPSYAVTAAHCVNGTTSDLQGLEVEMYRTSAALEQRYLSHAALAGSFPDFSHATLDESDGYLTDRYACELVARCSDLYGGRLACPADTNPTADAALLRCRGTPGRKYGFLELADSDDPVADVFLPWKHEIYSGASDDDRGFLDHYVMVSTASEDNYHYFGADASGHEQNQLLPLTSLELAPNVPHQKVSISPDIITTDLLGCHGTSGAGALQPSDDGRYQLLGPIVAGNHEHDEYLCDHIPALDGFSRAPGCQGIAYGGLGITQSLLSPFEAALALDCDPWAGASASLYTFQRCWRDFLSTNNTPLPSSAFGPSAARSSLNALAERSLLIGAARNLTLPSFSVNAGEAYRFGFAVRNEPGECGSACPRVRVEVRGSALFDEPIPTGSRSVAFPVASAFDGLATLRFDSGPNAALEVSEITLRPEAFTNSFDSFAERAEASLIDLDQAASPAQPMRFEGDGQQGFLARLLPHERMALSRQALTPSHLWSARFRVAGSGQISCGFLDASGSPVLTSDCSDGFVQLDARRPLASQPEAFFIETSSNSVALGIDDFRLVSDAMPDSDGDTVPDVLDDCEHGLTHGSASLSVSSPAVTLVEVCTPEPQRAVLAAPEVLGVCAAPQISGHLTRVNGRELPAPGVELAADLSVLLPLGTHEITWTIADTAGTIVASRISVAEVKLVSGVRCARPNQLVSQQDLIDGALSAAVPACLLGNAGDDLLIGSPGSDFIAGGQGSDYLMGDGGDDVFFGGSDDDYINPGAGGNVVIFAGDGDDTVHATSATSARIFGGLGRDVLVASPGNDTVFPGPGAKLLLLGAGDDTLRIYDSCELARGTQLSGGPGNDTLISPVSLAALRSAGVEVDGFETFVQDSSLAYLSECFGLP